MERGPLPPHERSWRHPSELAAEERDLLRAEAAAPSTRVFALTTGTVGLLAVAVLILTVSPQGQRSPVAISATTAPAFERSRPPTRAGLSAAASTSPAGVTSRLVESRVVTALATPIGDGSFALVTKRALDGRRATAIEVRLMSGAVRPAEVVAEGVDVVVVALADREPGHAIARHRPDDDDIVTVMVSPPITVPYGSVRHLDIAEGVPVLDATGAVVALCTERGGDVELLDVSDAIAGATSDDR